MSRGNQAVARLDSIQSHLKPAHYDVAVVGLGALGSAAAYYAAKKGAKVLGLEQFEFGHVRGASSDTSRIIRTSYELPQYVSLAQLAYQEWANLEAEAKQKLVTITGGVVILEKDGVPNGKSWAEALDAREVPYELLDAKEANQRWPAFNIKDHQEVMYTENSGIVHASKSVAAFQSLARARGAHLVEHTKVERIVPQPSGTVSIQTSRGRYTASKIIIASDAWTNQLLSPLGAEIPLEITQEQVTYFKPTDPEKYDPGKFPVWILTGKQWYYGFPCYGEPAIKAGHDNSKLSTTGDTRSFVPDAGKEAELAATLQGIFPDPGRKALRTVTCIYTITPDRQFVIAPVPKYDNVIVTLGAAHGFKFAPAFGSIAAELALDGKTEQDISLFGFPTPEMLANNPSRGKIGA